MNIFDKIIYTTLRENVTHLNKDDLDPVVFQFSAEGIPTLREGIRVQILRDIDEIRKVMPVVNFYLIGDILTRNYDSKTPIDVSVQIDSQAVDTLTTADVMYTIKQLNGHFASDTIHPIDYYIITHDIDEVRTEAIYDIMNDRWIKSPKMIDPTVSLWVTKFQDTIRSIDNSTGLLTRDIIDLKELHDMDTKYLNRLKIVLKQKLNQIDELLKQMTGSLRNASSIGSIAVERFSSPGSLHEFITTNKVPENVILKLMEKFYYLKFILSLEDILESRSELALTDIPELKKANSNVWKTS
jgi:hypothetical protein